jgi:hypothetical protein
MEFIEEILEMGTNNTIESDASFYFGEMLENFHDAKELFDFANRNGLVHDQQVIHRLLQLKSSFHCSKCYKKFTN